MDSRPVPPVFLSSLSGTSVRRGVWSAEEHDRFLQALKRFPDGPWQQLALCVGTRSTRQVQTHAQKFFEKIRRRQRGLRRSYIHTGVAREHRVDDDVVAILSSMPTSDQAEDDEGDDDGDQEEEEGDDDEEKDETKHSNSRQEDSEDLGDDQEKGEATLRTRTVPTSTKNPRPRAPSPAAGKRKRSSSSNNTQDSRPGPDETPATSPTPKTLPKRIRIRRSARNALQIAATREQLYLQAMNHGFTLADASSSPTPVDAVVASLSSQARTIDPVEPTRVDHLPSIEEALDFFLNSINADSLPSSQWFAEL